MLSAGLTGEFSNDTNKTRKLDSRGGGAPELWLNRQKLLLPQPQFCAEVSMENLQGRVDAESSVGLTSTPDRAEWWDPGGSGG